MHLKCSHSAVNIEYTILKNSFFMQIFLNKSCLSFTGYISRSWGYYIKQHRHKDGTVTYHSQRSKHEPIAAHGHLCFIGLCAEMALMKMYINDIKLDYRELIDALWEAGHYSLAKYYSANPHELTTIDPALIGGHVPDFEPVAVPADNLDQYRRVADRQRSEPVILNAEQTNNFFTHYKL